MEDHDDVRVRGALCLAIGQACINLNFFIDETTKAALAEIHPEEWCPLSTYLNLLDVVAARYADPAPIIEQIGVEMVRIWSEHGIDRSRIRNGLDFLLFQTSSEGYYSMVKGSPETIGDFALVAIDEQQGTAVVRSTTPFDKNMERGILRGGVEFTGSFTYVDVDNSADEHVFLIEFH